MEELKRSGLYIDEIYRLRVQDPTVVNQTVKLRQECLEYSRNLHDFKKLGEDFFKLSSSYAKEVEKDKLRSISTQNQLKTMAKQRQAEHQVYPSQVFEQTVNLERLKSQYQYLQRIESEQQETMSNFLMNQ
ncbi:CG30441 [Drosophila busckii]|uniref:CG30441 n=2 Tax=Drosophila busckii TaxID=30019 RepID=A0A0M4E7V7_DROBS|nr:CG30441 [Drosophila busckii]